MIEKNKSTMRKKKFNLTAIITLILIVFTSSCKDDWGDHYNFKSTEKSDLNLTEYIKSQGDLSKFAQMLAISGYDTILAKHQTYTVWAPDNSALAGFALTDTAIIRNLVENHITRFSHPTAAIDTVQLRMLDNKLITFAKGAGSAYSFGGKSLTSSNVATTNGILHTINGYVPYLSNLWESIGQKPGLDSLKAYLYSQSKLEFDKDASTQLGYVGGKMVYDSVFTLTNKFLTQRGALNNEDSIYTVLLPNIEAWTSSYQKIKEYYKSSLVEKNGGALQRQRTQATLVQDLVFKGLISNPSAADSLISTNSNIFQNPDTLFRNTQSYEASNGLAFVTNSLNFKAKESWNKTIRIEAEDEGYGRSKSNCDLYVRSGLGSAFNVSGDKYLIAEPNTTSSISKVFVKFPIPNTLSTKYNIYCVFVPTIITDITDTRPCKVNVYLSYIASGKTTPTEIPLVTNKETTGTQTTKLLVASNYQFPYCNLIDPESFAITDITVALRVENAAKTSETTKYNRTMRLDCI
ncbi:MAG: fasciclin domain-containing protein, partial [Bacteroidota bacterium]|nr:fasciclin domain-containing protein [Bacteroidota bacterium]